MLLLDDAAPKEISERLRLGRQADDIFTQALVDDVTRVEMLALPKMFLELKIYLVTTRQMSTQSFLKSWD